MDPLTSQSFARLLDAERRATAAATECGRPSCPITLDRVDEEHLGAFFQRTEFQTAFVGEMLKIDAFNQEGVELGKMFIFGLMGRAGYEPYRAQFAAYEQKRAAARLRHAARAAHWRNRFRPATTARPQPDRLIAEFSCCWRIGPIVTDERDGPAAPAWGLKCVPNTADRVLECGLQSCFDEPGVYASA